MAKGHLEEVTKMMGRHFSVSGRIVSGTGRGRTLGFPTANIETSPLQALPPDGVYATLAYLDGEVLPSATNIGLSPTFGQGRHRVEVHLIDFESELKASELRIEFVTRIRSEKRFPSAAELKVQIAKDVASARSICLGELTKPASK
jgi:riboflavin kinase/FMN adenylyltransferase